MQRSTKESGKTFPWMLKMVMKLWMPNINLHNSVQNRYASQWALLHMQISFTEIKAHFPVIQLSATMADVCSTLDRMEELARRTMTRTNTNSTVPFQLGSRNDSVKSTIRCRHGQEQQRYVCKLTIDYAPSSWNHNSEYYKRIQHIMNKFIIRRVINGERLSRYWAGDKTNIQTSPKNYSTSVGFEPSRTQ